MSEFPPVSKMFYIAIKKKIQIRSTHYIWLLLSFEFILFPPPLLHFHFDENRLVVLLNVLDSGFADYLYDIFNFFLDFL